MTTRPSSELSGSSSQAQQPPTYYPAQSYHSQGSTSHYQHYNPPSSPWSTPYPSPYQQYSQAPYGQYQHYQPPVKYTAPKPRTPTPSPPPLEFHKEWDVVIKSFLTRAGLTQAVKGFEADVIVMSEEWERTKVSGAIEDLAKDLLRLSQVNGKQESPGLNVESSKVRNWDERKLDYVHLSDGSEPRSQTSINKSISAFLARNRARNDASNKSEFLSQKRRRLNPESSTSSSQSEESPVLPSCARADAKPLDRDVQMKYDIAKNEEGPLRRTVKSENAQGKQKQGEEDGASRIDKDRPFDERLTNLETHLAVRYVPSPPLTIVARLKFLEDHIIQLEKEYPPWAALHFNQPNRGWPPPPRFTPIIVPSHLTSTAAPPQPPEVKGSKGSGRENKRLKKSSLHRAVMEKLEVKKAMSDLARG